METALVTGAGRGIGLALAQQLIDGGYRVIATCRGEPSTALRALESSGRLQIQPLEVTSQESIQDLAQALTGQSIDLLINNAGILGPDNSSLKQLDASDWLQTLAINTVAPCMISLALLDNLKRSANPRIITVSSDMASFHDGGSSLLAYRSSKAAVNKAMQGLALDLRSAGVIVCPVLPGWVQTDMGGPGASETPEESASGIIQLAQRLTLKNSGHFFTWRGNEYPW
ncbi:SDR family oxidoreductase [Marinobacterium lutimaris]|uniref:NAD(P)-dependent dehydrogenase, short-chain alcohol dehydrogenase family n=1 Tax=Marinobacterium lutimaris TaxID=568106 RepID=A0A1H6C367_9GAMM|nr:SDR family oxidoreductase [Marinobacterium lutimaris]SEG67333.1 NAD(P)-dependent dehydrogenase, short-chain alcohol dehydrogenase family [Marinobacterium lutimaris]